MKILKELRQHHKLTQKDIAERLEVTQQTVAKWENGKSEPSIAHLRDLALLYDTSVDELVRENANAKNITRNIYQFFGGSDNCFWGHIGLGVPNQEKSIWYPITLRTANQVINNLDNTFSDFIHIETLNNRTLFFNKKHLLHIHILDDNADYPKDDWELGWDSYQGLPAEIYPALSDYLIEGILELENYSPTFIKNVKEVLNEYPNLSEEDVSDSKVYTLSKIYQYYIDTDCFEDFIHLNYGNDNVWLKMRNFGIGMDTFISSHQIVLIDVPTHLFNKVYQDKDD